MVMPKDAVPALLAKATQTLEDQFQFLPPVTAPAEPAVSAEACGEVLSAVAQRMADNYPYFHPLYAGQMLKPPHPLARAAYALAMNINPNNHARDGGRASSEMEVEAVAQIARMFGWTEGYLGHLTSSGTIANLEALWIAARCAEDQPSGKPKRTLASEQAHYTHSRISAVLKLDFTPVAADNRGRMDLDALETELRRGDVATVVATLGTTALGAIDPLPEILKLREKYGFRIHVDAAYGGYFKLIPDELDEPARAAYAVIHQADSIVVDPHKHGLQPYGCGCVLFKDAAVGRFYKHDSPYTYFTSKDLHLGEISLECSRAGAAAVALWATQRALPLVPGGAFAAGLAAGRQAARRLDALLRSTDPERFIPLPCGPELDIVVCRVTDQPRAEASERAQRLFDACAGRNLHLALVHVPEHWFHPEASESEMVTCLRSVLMKPEHEAWMDRIWQELAAAADQVLA